MAWTTPKTDWTTGELVSASDMNSIGENLNTLRQKAIATSTLTNGIDATLGSSFVDVDSANLNLTITTVGGDVMVHFCGSVDRRGGTTSTRVHIDIEVNGARQGGDTGILVYQFKTDQHNMSFTRLIQGLSAGSHTFKLQWKGGAGVYMESNAQFVVREI